MAERISPELQAQLGKFKQLQDQLNNLLAQKGLIDSELKEINRVLEELTPLPADASIYKVVGNIMVKVEKASVEKELNERKELLELRSKNYKRQEEMYRKQYEELREKLTEALNKYNQGAGGALKA